MKYVGFYLKWICIFCIVSQVYAAEPYVPKKDSAEQKAILESLNLTMSAVLNNQPVAAKIDKLCVYENYAHIAFTPINPDGGEFNYDQTSYARHCEAEEDCFTDTDADAILYRINNAWYVVAFGLRLHEPPQYMLDPSTWLKHPVYKTWPKQILDCK